MAALGRLGRCQALMGHTEAAIARFREALALAHDLEDTAALAHMIADLHTDLGAVRRACEDLAVARQAYDAALTAYLRNREFRLASQSARRLAWVCDDLGDGVAARDYARRARRLYGRGPDVHEALAAYAPFIEQVAAADAGRHAALEPLLAEGEAAGWTGGLAAVRRILAGERGEDALCAGLDLDDQQVICAILRAVRQSGAGTD